LYSSIIEFGTPQYGELVSLRDLVLRKPLGLEFKSDDLAEEYSSIHLGCYNDRNELLGCLVLKPLNAEEVKMRQVAVFPDIQKQGSGTFLVQSSEMIAKAKGYSKMVLSARLPAVPFYERLDYNIDGDIYQEVGIDHLKMWKLL
jgi:predicted GNAT family N-acyltransferase